MLLTDRDREILDTLTHRVRCLTPGQIARTWYPEVVDAEKAARRRLKLLEAEGLVDVFHALAHPEVPLEAPLLAWTPGDPEPDFDALAWRLRRRFNQPPVMTCLAVAGKRAANWLGGCLVRRPRRSEVGHDIGLGGVFLKLLRDDPRRATRWQSEGAILDQRRAKGGAVPDAVIVERSGKTAIEYGGLYPAWKLRKFHRYCAGLHPASDTHLAYELW
jgi:hypothetical protein